MRFKELNALEEAEAEEAAGMSLAVLDDEQAPKSRLFAALAWAHKRRDSAFTQSFGDYLRSTRSPDVIEYLFGAESDAEEAAEADPFRDDDEPSAGAGGAEGAVLPGDGSAAV